MNNKAFDVNLAATYYDKNNTASMLSNAVSSEQNGVGFYYIDKKRANDWLSHNRLQLPLAYSSIGSDNNISRSDTDVKQKFSQSTSEIDYPALLKENTDLKKQNEALAAEMKLTEGHKVSRGAVEKLAGKILREYK